MEGRYKINPEDMVVTSNTEPAAAPSDKKDEPRAIVIRLGGRQVRIPLDWDTIRTLLDDRIHTGG